MTISSLLGLEILAGSLALNIEAYATAGAKAKRYRLYSVCRHQETERRRVYAVFAEWLTELPELPISSRAALMIRKMRTMVRLSYGDEHVVIAELLRKDTGLIDTIRTLASHSGLPFTVSDAIRRLEQLILEAEAELDRLQSKGRGRRNGNIVLLHRPADDRRQFA